MKRNEIEIIDASENNLKNIDLSIKKNCITAICGPSGCGKTSLAIDTIVATSSYRLHLHNIEKKRDAASLPPAPKVVSISGLPPVISTKPKILRKNWNTIASFLEIDQLLYTLYQKEGKRFCAYCGELVISSSVQEIVEDIQKKHQNKLITITSKVSLSKEDVEETLQKLLTKGFNEAILNNKLYDLDLDSDYQTFLNDTPSSFYSIVDYVTISNTDATRILHSILNAQSVNDYIAIHEKNGDSFTLTNSYSTAGVCINHHKQDFSITKNLFDFKIHQEAENNDAAKFNAFYKLKDFEINQFLSLRIENLTLSEILKDNISLVLKRLDDASTLKKQLSIFEQLKLDYINLLRSMDSLSSGEFQRLKIIQAMNSKINGLCYVLDEPSNGLSSSDIDCLLNVLKTTKDNNNTILIVEHNKKIIENADDLIVLGPTGGKDGGYYLGNDQKLLPKVEIFPKKEKININNYKDFIEISGASLHNLKDISLKIPLNTITAITGDSGAGKSSLIVNTLAPILEEWLKNGSMDHLNKYKVENVNVNGKIDKVVIATNKIQTTNNYSTLLTYTKTLTYITNLFANTTISKIHGFSSGMFSLSGKDSYRCTNCKGLGIDPESYKLSEYYEMPCPVCDGKRFRDEILQSKFKGLTIDDVFNLNVSEGLDYFGFIPKCKEVLGLLNDFNLDYLLLGQPIYTLSHGEFQRLHVVNNIYKTAGVLYIFDEPTSGLDAKQINNIIDLLNKLVKKGNSIIAIEHNENFIAQSDYIVTLESGRLK